MEAPQGGFNPDGTPRTLFEGHKFHQFTDAEVASGYSGSQYERGQPRTLWIGLRAAL